MNIFERKNKTSTNITLPTSPIELYQTCAYKDGYGYLRGIQEEVLEQWHSNRHQRDVLCKMNTGSGKTLTGLLMLYSKLVEGIGPCLYVCPDNQLLNQTIDLARNYGIPICVFETNSFPADFLNNKGILLCSFHKLFNGKSIFNRDSIRIGAVLLDDAHKCADIARDIATIKLERSHTISTKLFDLFTASLKEQLAGTFYRLEFGDPTMMMKVPYWAWLDQQEQIIKIISEYVAKISDDYDNKEGIKFSWNVVADNLSAYDCYFGSDYMEISPIHVPYHEIKSFNEAKHRYILSATFEDSYDLIRDLGISYESIINPITPRSRKDVGKRLIIAPKRYAPTISDDGVKHMIAAYSKIYNVIVLVPSTNKAIPWTTFGAQVVDKGNIEDSILKLKETSGNFMVFVNRYDGIDLHNDLCRILVIDGIPNFSSLVEQYYEGRMDSIRASKRAQIIEQGIGRATRSGGDFSVTFLVSSDLIDFMGYSDNFQYFTPISRAQIQAGLDLLESESAEDPLNIIKETTDLCLTQNKDFLEFHSNVLRDVIDESISNKNLERLLFADIEREALDKFRRRKYGEAAGIIINKLLTKSISDKERAWYYQLSAQFMYPQNTLDSNNFQVKANDLSTLMFYPKHTTSIYRPIKSRGLQAAEINKLINKFMTAKDIVFHINSILDNLIYDPNISANKFEYSLTEIGRFLGFNVQRPEQEIGNGPDVLWCMSNGVYLLLEAKSEAVHLEISKDNINQLLGTEQWFKNQYPGREYLLVTLQKPSRKSKNVNISPLMRVIDNDSLEILRKNLKHFISALQNRATNANTDSEIEQLLTMHFLTPELFSSTYLKFIR